MRARRRRLRLLRCAVCSRCTERAPFPEIAERRLAGRIALGIERTIDQDPAFALRILVDIAIRALSPAVNDPTTAVQVIDHLEDTLALIGGRRVSTAAGSFATKATTLRLVHARPAVRGFLSLGITEIREYGGLVDPGRAAAPGGAARARVVRAPRVRAVVAAELERLRVTAAAAFGGRPTPRGHCGRPARDRRAAALWPTNEIARCQRPSHAVGFARGCSPRTRRGIPLRAGGGAAAEGGARTSRRSRWPTRSRSRGSLGQTSGCSARWRCSSAICSRPGHSTAGGSRSSSRCSSRPSSSRCRSAIS